MSTSHPSRSSAVSLRDVREEDIPILFEHQRDEESNRMAAFPARDRAAHEAHWRKIAADEDLVTKAIVRRDEVVGNAVAWDNGTHTEIGYWIGREHWGQGIATAAVRELLTVVETRPLYAHVAAHNVGSLKVLEKCGFRRVGAEIENGVEMVTMELAGN